MAIATALIIAAFVTLGLMNGWATWRVLHDDLATPFQRNAQIALVWVIPLFGALLTLYLKRQHLAQYSGTYPEPHDHGDDFGIMAAQASMQHGNGESQPHSFDSSTDSVSSGE